MENTIAHVIVYHDFEDDYIGLDVFATYEAALMCWEEALKGVIALHGDGWIEEIERNEAERELYFNTNDGYECFYREEIVQQGGPEA